MMTHCKIISDNWDDLNKVWEVLEYKTRPNSTAVELTLIDEYGIKDKRVVASHMIEWIKF